MSMTFDHFGINFTRSMKPVYESVRLEVKIKKPFQQNAEKVS